CRRACRRPREAHTIIFWRPGRKPDLTSNSLRLAHSGWTRPVAGEGTDCGGTTFSPCRRGVVVNAGRPLLVMLVHGIGPQNAPAQGESLDRLQDATTRRLGEIRRAGLASAILAAWIWIMPLFPWGHLLMFGRTFEANTASDVILYGSDEPRRQIRDVVLAKIQPYLSSKYALAGGARECLPVVLIGHSLGSVVVYDLLLGISARMGARKVTAAQRELSAVTQQLRGAAVRPAAGAAAAGAAGREA